MDRITLRNLRVFTHIGCTSEERDVGQHLEMDLEMWMDLREAGTTDRIGASVDYAAAAAAVREAVVGVEANLLETVAERAAAAVLALGVPRTTVRVRKPHPPMPGAHADHAEVEIHRGRVQEQRV